MFGLEVAYACLLNTLLMGLDMDFVFFMKDREMWVLGCYVDLVRIMILFDLCEWNGSIKDGDVWEFSCIF